MDRVVNGDMGHATPKGKELKDAKVVGNVGYTVVYAVPVHDPENKQRFRRPSAEKEFLSEGFEGAELYIRTVIKGAIKT